MTIIQSISIDLHGSKATLKYSLIFPLSAARRSLLPIILSCTVGFLYNMHQMRLFIKKKKKKKKQCPFRKEKEKYWKK